MKRIDNSELPSLMINTSHAVMILEYILDSTLEVFKLIDMDLHYRVATRTAR